MSETVKLGKVSMTLGGDYNSSQAYDKLTCVYYDGSSWVSRKAVPAGVAPTAVNSAYWQKVSDRGAQGPQGQSYVDKTLVPIVNDLTTGGTSNVLAAEQGKVLDAKLTELESETKDIRKEVDVIFSDWVWINDRYIGEVGTIVHAENLRMSEHVRVSQGDVVRISGAGTNIAGVAKWLGGERYEVLVMIDSASSTQNYECQITEDCQIAISGRYNRNVGNIEGVIIYRSGIKDIIDSYVEDIPSSSYLAMTIDAEGKVIECISQSGKHTYIDENFKDVERKSTQEVNNVSIIEGDADGFIHHFVKDDGTHVFPVAIESPNITSLQKAIPTEQHIKSICNSLGRFAKGKNYGIPPANYEYTGLQGDYTWGTSDTLTSEVYEKFDELVDGHVFIKEKIGNASDGQDLYLYKYVPQQTKRQNDFTKGSPTILIMSGIHGFEKSSTYGIYYLLKDILENPYSNEVLRYFNMNVNLWVIPVANPSGWDVKSYFNSNNVNLNNNFDTPGWTESWVNSFNTGAAPFDQPESSAIGALLRENKEVIDLFINNHTNGGGVVEINDINWIDLTTCGDDSDVYFNTIKKVAFAHSLNISSLLRKEFGDAVLGLTGSAGEDAICSHLTWNDPMPTTGFSTNYAINNDIIGCCFEEFNGFPNGELYTANVKRACSMLIAHFMIYFCSFYSNFMK